MQLRIKKNIPQAFFELWEKGTQSDPEVEVVRFFRDSYLNLIASGLQHFGFYVIVFSKVNQSQPAFQSYLKTIDPQWRDIVESYRNASLKSSRKHLGSILTLRIIDIINQLEESS